MTQHNMQASKTASELAELYQKPDGIYALAHSVGPLCKAAQHDLNAHFMEPWRAYGGDAWPTWLSHIDKFKEQLGSLLQAHAEDFCPQPSVSFAFSQWLASVSKQRVSTQRTQRKVVLMHQDAFASLGFAVQGLCEVYDLALRFITSPSNDLDAWHSALSKQDVFACLVTHAHSNTGALSKVENILALAKQHNVLGAVDIAQSIGIIPIDLSKWQADCVVGSCVKWLSGGPGAAFLYIPSEQADTLMPEHLAWFSHHNPFEFDIKHFAPAKGVMRFWGGTPSIAPYMMAASALEQHNRYGTEVFRRHNLKLMRHFLLGSSLLGDYLAIPEHYQTLVALNDSQISKLGCYDNVDIQHTATLCLELKQAKADAIKARLHHEKVKFDNRHNMLRLSFSAVNTLDDVEQVIGCFL